MTHSLMLSCRFCCMKIERCKSFHLDSSFCQEPVQGTVIGTELQHLILQKQPVSAQLKVCTSPCHSV